MKRLLLLTSALITGAAFAGTLAGSDIVGPALTPALTGITTDFRGTLDALRDLRSGKASAALVFIRSGEIPAEVTAGTWYMAAVAHQPIIVVVNDANHAAEIDLPTLAGLYGNTVDTAFDTWRCLPASTLTQGPLAIAPHPGRGIAVSYFQQEVLAGEPYRKSVRFAANADDEESRATTTVNSIALLARPPKSSNLKVLAVSDSRPGKSTKAYFPADSDVNSGDYPLRVPLYVIFPAKTKAAAAPAVKAVLSENAANLLRDKGLIATPENIRKKFTQTLDSNT